MKEKILVYDDDEEILFLCQAILSKFGYAVVTLARCENILNDIKSIQPDLILMDLWIPEIGGEKAIELVKKNESTKNIPVIVFSANADIREICEKVNADGYVEKPFNVSTFMETIERQIA